ncbi:MOSC domain-containing protein [Amnibacterium sp. CER49]|uniref:MOSC domain-containing protein n=1 Tax=Amnibacterium sp. CER49 TaxID=3039161 RepID=UPI00244CCBA4|nr:MOSC domain-containing protein [Amnibacterium sp. CER49]MDH2442755.1 MOSC domain-containing protein [Amnibacterium sp. CER49]
MPAAAVVVGVARSPRHAFSKDAEPAITLVEGLGVEGDAHAGTTVQHRSRVRRDPTQPNLRQVHLIPIEVLEDAAAAGFVVPPGAMGENVTTRGVDLLGLPTGTLLELGPDAVVRVTGLRNPCSQIDDHQRGLLKQMLGRDDRGEVVRRAGVMGVVVAGGVVRRGDPVATVLPDGAHVALQPV